MIAPVHHFDAERHLYYRDGNLIPGVTEVLREAGMVTDHARTDPFYALRGQIAHEAIALDIRGELDESTVDPEIEPFVLRARKAWREIQHLDSVVGDWKCGAIEPGHKAQVTAYERAIRDGFKMPAGLYLEHRVFDVGYGGTIDFLVHDGSSYIPVLLLISLATDPPKIERVYDTRHHYDAFRSALNLYHWKRRERLL